MTAVDCNKNKQQKEQMNLDTISFTVTAPGAGGTAMAAVAGDSLQIRNGAKASLILCLAMWTNGQVTPGYTQLLWPSGHDLVRGVRYRNQVLQPDNKVPLGAPLRFRAQDPLTLLEVGSATAGDVETAHMLMFYEDLPGVDAHMINMATLRKRGVSNLTVEDSTTAAAASTYGGPRALNVGSDLLKADTEYALLGAVIGANCGALTVRGVDSGNLRVAIPGLTQDANWTSNWFGLLSEANDLPCIPVFNSANRAGIFVENVTNELLTAVPFSLNMVQLSP